MMHKLLKYCIFLDSITHKISFLNDNDLSASIEPLQYHTGIFKSALVLFTNIFLTTQYQYFSTGIEVYSSDINSDVSENNQNRANHLLKDNRHLKHLYQ